MGGGANVCLDWEVSTDEQGLRVFDEQQREFDLSGDDSAHPETAYQVG